MLLEVGEKIEKCSELGAVAWWIFGSIFGSGSELTCFFMMTYQCDWRIIRDSFVYQKWQFSYVDVEQYSKVQYALFGRVT